MAQTNHVPAKTVEVLLEAGNIRKRFDDMLGKKAAGFISSIISAVSQNPGLKKSEPMSIISAAAIAASLDLPINPSLGFSYIVPYTVKGESKGQFQLGWKGLVQLAQRTGQYKTINVAIVFEGELVHHDKFTGDMKFSSDAKKSNTIMGFMAYMKLVNGFEKYAYMTMEEANAHGKRYSKSYDSPSGPWQQYPEAMRLKTVLKALLSKWGPLSVDLQTAIRADQAIIRETEAGGVEFDYPDNPEEPFREEEGGPTLIDLEAIQKFDTAMEEKKVDPAILQQFLTETAGANEMTVDQVKIAALKEIEGFFTHFSKFAEMRKKFGRSNENQGSQEKSQG